MKSIMGTEGQRKSGVITNDPMIAAKQDSARATCHEVVAVGPDVTKTYLGEQVLHLSTAADAADYDKWEKKESKYLFCHEDDVIGGWDFDEAVRVMKELESSLKA